MAEQDSISKCAESENAKFSSDEHIDEPQVGETTTGPSALATASLAPLQQHEVWMYCKVLLKDMAKQDRTTMRSVSVKCQV